VTSTLAICVQRGGFALQVAQAFKGFQFERLLVEAHRPVQVAAGDQHVGHGVQRGGFALQVAQAFLQISSDCW
jgi:hypothetical protein